MVSLINFKRVGDELTIENFLSNQQQDMHIKVSVDDQEVETEEQVYYKQQGSIEQQAFDNNTKEINNQQIICCGSDKLNCNHLNFFHNVNGDPEQNIPQPPTTTPALPSNPPGPSFVVTWRNLKFSIEPKWHQKLLNKQSFASSPTLAIIENNQNEQVSNQQSVVTKIVLDKLDGSFKSGQLTAILGPSGAGKTTLLDCLTGHRKNGLSGSIRISSCRRDHAIKANNNNNNNNNNKINCSSLKTSQFSSIPTDNLQTGQIDKNNLKVSIIPQNDHLMGHLTVYETLCYASKLKNCFEPNFNHKANIKRIAQQLGLISCLNNRVNKLSGGQYKRVSIAQELLSSPDILILDEPTSGLDAMTCYQTIQVLRRLTDHRNVQNQKEIAVILTIHQPNSDVFQQFNHVYVVGHGGKCIFEGPPSGIESVIKRIGLRLPNNYYNPATMIVEIAAGKYGQDAIFKLNNIQKKQYSEKNNGLVPDEQNSTGDSAVDCSPSTSSSSSTASFSQDEQDELEQERARKKVRQDNDNNNLGVGHINKAFTMESSVDCKEVIVIGGGEEADTDSMDKVTNNNNMLCITSSNVSDNHRRKKRRRTRKRSVEVAGNQNQNQQHQIQTNKNQSFWPKFTQTSQNFTKGGHENPNEPSKVVEKRVKLNSLKADQKFPFWRHTYLHFHRSWLSIIRDPMLCSMQLALHIIVPVMVSLVYGTHVGKPNACPRAGPMDIMAYALEPTDTALQLQEDLRTTLENIGYIFFKLYGIIFAAMTVTVLTFPLDMHVLVKEFRNGWYGLSSYFLGRTLADIPFQLTLPFLAMSLSYYATGQPYSYMQWRFLSITAILILSSLIAQSQGLLFGAILMDRMKAAVFVAPAATTPIILFAGFLVRTQSIPYYLRPLSNLSYLRYAIEACLISRYGFNQCQCDPAIFDQTVPELPPIARSMLDYWLSSFKAAREDLPSIGDNSTSSIETTTTTTISNQQENPDLFNKLISSLAKANSFGRNISSCEEVVPYPMIDYDLHDSQLFNCFAILISMLILTRLLTFFIVCFKVKRKV